MRAGGVGPCSHGRPVTTRPQLRHAAHDNPKPNPQVLGELGILRLRIQRMPPDNGLFDRPATFDHFTVCSPSCHDTTTTRAWCATGSASRLSSLLEP